MTTQQERDALTLRALVMLNLDERTLTTNHRAVAGALAKKYGISLGRARSYTARAARIVRGAFVRGRAA